MSDLENNDEIEVLEDELNDEVSLEDEESNSQQKIKSLRVKLKQAEEAKKQILEDLQRAKAEFLNSKKRLTEESHRNSDRTINKQMTALLPLCDSFQMALSNKDAWESVDEVWRKGMEGIYNQLQNILETNHVTVMNPLNEEFDPHQHEAMSTVDSDLGSEKVVEVLQFGYQRNNEVIRPAKVIISN